MPATPTLPPLDITELVDSWVIALKSARRSSSTLKIYTTSVDRYLQWCDDHGHPRQIDRGQVSKWLAEILDAGAQPTTAAARLAGVRQFSKWLAEEGEIPSDPLLRLTAPKGDMPITPVLCDDELKALIKACNGNRLRDRRDEAIVRLLAETGMRAGELIALELDDVDLTRGLAYIRRGKGGKGRIVPFGPQTARALDRYIRLRRGHRGAESRALWLGARTHQPLGPHGLRVTLLERAEMAGITGFHPHVLRHTAASRWLSKGGTEGGLMSVAGWSSREMLDRYARVTASERAAAEARGLNLGDL
ncbi:tyrosine-type recombinase/integrase [Mycobacterium europaeum]|uniref:tyrosine-type recombinase/integrase n=1 Tax=Mycobacterium europaeum TaxID=761804 RepID=UPI002AE0A972|nr:tyrosine-type recombinase/integrase [Mycobacterium europaeum]MEA1159430.1 tyrosine-type recombinase/integrase [Mycobacterium europaeum]